MRPQINRTDNDSAVANYIAAMIDRCPKTQRQIAIDSGFEKSVNSITLIKNGRMKISVDRVIPLCKACQEDPEELMSLVLQEYMPAVLEAVGEIRGEVIVDDEKKLLAAYRVIRRRAIRQFREQTKTRNARPVLDTISIAKALNKSIAIRAA